jgi:hypothetical protein
MARRSGLSKPTTALILERADNLDFYREHWFTEIGHEPDDMN